eukprot:TRINITY_DN7094_c0_g1_i1.p1 TRINITY_DN7094_c0_g1~~TRINITY_DN7094_c0_g1_i1.p1  ORF type:complete len:238 (+),score=49.58 TRINITY_DN7094_c0_g1_i1:104-715(+)
MKRVRREVKPLTAEVREALEGFRFGDDEGERVEGPALGMSARMLYDMAMPAEVMKMECGGLFPELEGMYKLSKETFNGMPMWTSGPATLYSSAQGLWSIVDTANGPSSDLGWITTIDTHYAMMPHTIHPWQAYHQPSGQWLDLTISPFTRFKKPVRKSSKKSCGNKKQVGKERAPSVVREKSSSDEGSLGPSECSSEYRSQVN